MNLRHCAETVVTRDGWWPCQCEAEQCGSDGLWRCREHHELYERTRKEHVT